MMNTNLEGAETANSGDFVATNDFREIVLIRDPKSGGSAATAATLRATYAVKISNPSGTFTADEEITQTTTGAGGKVCRMGCCKWYSLLCSNKTPRRWYR